MHITTVLFDLDGTLLPMQQEVFVQGYFKLLAEKLAPYGYDAENLISAIWNGIKAMVQNDGSKTNEDVFWTKFVETFGEKVLSDKTLFQTFYENDFLKAKEFCGFNPKAAETVKAIRNMGCRVVLATNPIFPAVATEARIRWAGLEPTDFDLYTTYENSSHCKPNTAYYEEILKRLNVSAEECLMVGNDVTEDMVAQKLGIRVFLLTDCLINKGKADITQYPRGSFGELLEYINSLAD